MQKALAEIFHFLDNETYTTAITGVVNVIADTDEFEIKEVNCEHFKQILVNQDYNLFYIPMEDYFIECRYLSI